MGSPRLSVCIPTHHGRGALLAELLDDLAAARDPRVDVVVADNASADETAEVVARAQGKGLAIDYRRHSRDIGVALNLASVVRQADGDFCWLVSSDDRLVPGAVARVLKLLDAHPDAAGMTVHQAVMEFDLAWVVEQQAGVAVPPLREVTELDGATEVTGALGWIMSGLSSQIVRRETWLACEEVLERSQLFPHTAVMLEMAASGRPWVWCPHKLVFVRGDNYEVPVSRDRWESRLLRELDGRWRAAAGSRSQALREVRDRYLAAAERRSRRPRPAALVPPMADDIALLRTTTAVLWSLPRYWRELGPRLAARALTPRRAQRRERPAMATLAPADRRGRVVAALPALLVQADECWLRATLHNDGPIAWRSAGPHGVHLASRWRRPGDPAWHDGPRTLLTRPLPGGQSCAVDCCIVAPWDTGEWELELSLVQESVAWFADEDRASSVRAVVVVRPS